ncbi:MAG TPA: hypothetical protein VMW53_09595 [archaeon]|nr:hypothetical protein [archaeon]
MKKELRHDRHTVSLLTDHMVITPKYLGKFYCKEDQRTIEQDIETALSTSQRMVQGSSMAPGCYHGSVGQGWEVVEKYISTQDCTTKNK